MDLRLVDLRRGPADDCWWTPAFDETVTYEHPDWWNPHNFGTEDPWYVQVLEHGVEVARVELKEDVDIDHYANVPAVGSERLEIAFIEVATAECGRGIGTQVMRELERRHPGRRLLAYSEEADGFWASLGWEPFHHPEGDWRTLFIQPASRDLRHLCSLPAAVLKPLAR
ncbi:GNAT family N-acetyltransferase [Mycobacteroides abscessus]|uniref:GNAT family N-acetyltransferase n=1 Tax=Mycobacteroides abscessus TaxID=36809 RepID=UPI0005E33AC1|nr:GNAT family N-acetyltransferase [Mycobacteroides abscessus]CPR69922.1 acetyltransferase%2C gnat family protein [Mycobacteroides abscessus]CPU70481.1 acetyltransferase%2C gnat family protein [Mycobacteroides abscessus]